MTNTRIKPEEEKENIKRTYEKPRLLAIELSVDEVLGIGCKLWSGGSAYGVTPCPANICLSGGS